MRVQTVCQYRGVIEISLENSSQAEKIRCDRFRRRLSEAEKKTEKKNPKGKLQPIPFEVN